MTEVCWVRRLLSGQCTYLFLFTSLQNTLPLSTVRCNPIPFHICCI